MRDQRKSDVIKRLFEFFAIFEIVQYPFFDGVEHKVLRRHTEIVWLQYLDYGLVIRREEVDRFVDVHEIQNGSIYELHFSRDESVDFWNAFIDGLLARFDIFLQEVVTLQHQILDLQRGSRRLDITHIIHIYI